MTRICPVYRADVVYESSCIPCVCFDAKTTACKVITGEVKAHNDNGVIIVEVKHASTPR
jgi:hypothetical protein